MPKRKEMQEKVLKYEHNGRTIDKQKRAKCIYTYLLQSLCQKKHFGYIQSSNENSYKLLHTIFFIYKNLYNSYIQYLQQR